MDPAEIEFTSLVGWLRTFTLQSKASTPSELSDGLAMSEALVQIEPSVFTPTWFAGILQSDKSNNENLNTLLNLILHYYRNNLGDVCISGDLPVPDIPDGCQELRKEMISRLLKLILGVAVTCSNKQTFIRKIQSLDETTQHALTSCVASFIYTREWVGRMSAQSLNSDLKASTPPGDEIWAQKCHELDFQVALLKEERTNLINENEDLYGKMKTAQTLSRKDSVKAKHFEAELAHIKDEFERLRLAYECTRDHINNVEGRLKSGGGSDLSEYARISEETNLIKTELAGLKAVLRVREGAGANGLGGGILVGEGEVLGQLQEQGEHLAQLRAMVDYQATLQAGLSREVECLKDQVDVLREQSHNHIRNEMELQELRSRLQEYLRGGEQPDIDDGLRMGECETEAATLVGVVPNRTLMSLESETCISSSNETGENSQSNSMANNLLEETLVSANHIEAEQLGFVVTNSLKEELRLVQQTLPETNSCLEEDTMTETTPFVSRPESELDLGLTNDPKEEVEATPRQLEMLLEESQSQASSSKSHSPGGREEFSNPVDQLLQDIRDSGLENSLEDIEAMVRQEENFTRTSQDLSSPNFLINKDSEQLFDPNDPKVKELEDWNCSIDKSVLGEETPKMKLKKVFSLKRLNKTEEKHGLLFRDNMNQDGEKDDDTDALTADCLNSWMLHLFVKVFD